MRIRKLDLNGFKSFPDRTVVEFGAGISAVVGPNGSGKSNILDAIRWVVGEQSARALRGGEMQDVIFAGSADRAPVSYAEVVLTLATDDGEPFPGEYARFSELQVGRRLHRSGASEYFVNQTRCRRRDVTDLFLDTGVATDLYSFIEQGSIGRIVHATPAERRVLVEEAAGISRYKARREEAHSRLVETATQLDRAADVAEEMGHRLRHLEAQVARAVRFRRLRARIRQQEIVLALARYADLTVERRRLREEHREAQRKADEADRHVRRQQGDADARREEAAVVEAAAHGWRDEVAEEDARIRELEAALAFAARRSEELTRSAEAVRDESAALAERSAAAADERQVARGAVVAGELALAAVATRLGAAAQALGPAQIEAEAIRTRVEEAERLAAHDTSRRERARLRRADLDEERTRAASERERRLREAEDGVRDRATAEQALESAQTAAAEATDALASQVARAALATAEGTALRERVAAATRALADAEAAREDRRRAAEQEGKAAIERIAADVGRRLEALATRHEAERKARGTEGAAVLAAAARDAEEAVRRRTEALATARSAAWALRDAARDRLAANEEQIARCTRERLAAEGHHAGLVARDRPEGAALGDRPSLLARRHDAGLDPDALAALGDRALLPVVGDETEILALAAAGRRIRVAWDVRPIAAGEILPGTLLVDDLAAALARHRQTGGAAAVRTSGEGVGADGVVTLGPVGDEARAAALRREEALRLEATAAALRLDEVRLTVEQHLLATALADATRAAEAAEATWRDGERSARAEADAILAKARAERDEAETRARTAAEAEREALRAERDARVQVDPRDPVEQAELEARVVAARTARDEAIVAANAGEEVARGISAFRVEAEVVVARRRGEVEAFSARRSAVIAAGEAVATALSRLDEERQRRDAEIAALDATLAADAPALDLEALRGQRAAAVAAEHGLREAHAAALLDHATAQERLAARRSAVQEAVRRVEDLEAQASALAARSEQVGAAVVLNDDTARRAAADLETARTARGAAWERLLRDRERTAHLRQVLAALEEDVRAHAATRDASAREAGDLDVRAREAQVEVEALRKRLEERYLVVLPALLDRLETHGHVVVETDEQARADVEIGGRLHPGVPDLEIRASHLQDYDAVAALVEEVEAGRRQITALGDVNLAAVEEYDDVRKRHGDLVAQRTDLEQATLRLREAIAKMNRTSRERFRETFDRVAENLARLYPRLTGGGVARLALTDEEDLLETGVEIFVQPPGKRLQNLALLSGGEKAMTAIAVLLSLFQVKPSPFCVLDEVDAPLDEVNGTRFNEMLREMSTQAQFIVITHNRKTMEAADTLYGITMPSPGVSRLVSVRLSA